MHLKRILLIDIGATRTKIGIGNEFNKVHFITSAASNLLCSTPNDFEKGILSLLIKHDLSFDKISEVRIAIHGIVKGNKLIESTRLEPFIDFNFKSILNQKVSTVINDVLAMLIGCAVFFDLMKEEFRLLSFGTGIGYGYYTNSTFNVCEDTPNNLIIKGENLHKYLGTTFFDSLTHNSNSLILERMRYLTCRLAKLKEGRINKLVMLGGNSRFIHKLVAAKMLTVNDLILITEINKYEIIPLIGLIHYTKSLDINIIYNSITMNK